MGRAGRSGDRIPVEGEIFCTPAVRPTQPSLQGVPGLCPRGKAVGVWPWPPPPSAEVKERVELYLYPPVRFRGLLQGKFYKLFSGTLSINPADKGSRFLRNVGLLFRKPHVVTYQET